MRRDIILIANNNAATRTEICDLFSQSYKTLEASNGHQTLELLKDNQDSIAIVILDMVMDDGDGLWVLRQMNESKLILDVPVIMVTGTAMRDDEKTAYELGVSEVVREPIEAYVMKRRVSTILDLYSHKLSLEERVEQQTSALLEQELRLKKINTQVIETLSSVVEFRNLESGMHIKRIKSFTKCLLEHAKQLYPEYGLTEEIIDNIALASVMHDVGKISIPDAVLLKPGRFTPDEFEIMKSHTIRGCEIIDALADRNEDPYFRICYDIARHHHERYDGRGYPDKLVGDDIPYEAQFVGVADVYDALVSERCYKKAFPKDQAFAMICNGECGMFSPKLLKCFANARADFEKLADDNGAIVGD
jgi:putative two-component system response regulator